jgi:predicted Zn-ribbon and HTH transcriptional regulator
MSWVIACFCGYIYETEEDKSHCPSCKRSFIRDDYKPELEEEMQAELDRVIELGEWGIL